MTDIGDRRKPREGLPKGAPPLQNLEGLSKRQASIVKFFDLNLADPEDLSKLADYEIRANSEGIGPDEAYVVESGVTKAARMKSLGVKDLTGN